MDGPARSTRSEHARASELLASVRDVIDERAHDEAPPAWCVRRGWTRFLETLSDDAVGAIERDGLAAGIAALPDAPGDLAALAHAVARATDLRAPPRAAAQPAISPRGASPRKREQVAAVAALTARVGPRPARVVDLGSGHGHLTRHLARALGVAAEGWDKDPARVDAATRFTPADGPRFVARDAGDPRAVLRASDLVVGLHACGALGEHAVRAAAAARASVVLVACCPQKREGPRAPLVLPDGLEAPALTLARDVLGLANATDGEHGVEADLATRTRSRVQRRALGALLRDAGRALEPGAEMHGVNRRRATGAFDALVLAAFATRGLATPSDAACASALRDAEHAYRSLARWSLPRMMLARLLEVWIALDRAAWLDAQGYDAVVVQAFARASSPRNVAVVGAPR